MPARSGSGWRLMAVIWPQSGLASSFLSSARPCAQAHSLLVPHCHGDMQAVCMLSTGSQLCNSTSLLQGWAPALDAAARIQLMYHFGRDVSRSGAHRNEQKEDILLPACVTKIQQSMLIRCQFCSVKLLSKPACGLPQGHCVRSC